jgi:hypothetical protein
MESHYTFPQLCSARFACTADTPVLVTPWSLFRCSYSHFPAVCVVPNELRPCEHNRLRRSRVWLVITAGCSEHNCCDYFLIVIGYKQGAARFTHKTRPIPSPRQLESHGLCHTAQPTHNALNRHNGLRRIILLLHFGDLVQGLQGHGAH